MDHVAIMRKSWGLLPKILSGEKTIESRWYRNKVTPWDRISAGDTIYFKNSGEPVTVRAKAGKVLQFADLTEEKIYKLRGKYAKELGLKRQELDWFDYLLQRKRYGILIFLTRVRKIEPFNIDKKGFGSAAAWICIEDIAIIRHV